MKSEYMNSSNLNIGVGGGDARTRDECQARGAGRAGPACPPSVRPPHVKRDRKGSRIIEMPLCLYIWTLPLAPGDNFRKSSTVNPSVHSMPSSLASVPIIEARGTPSTQLSMPLYRNTSTAICGGTSEISTMIFSCVNTSVAPMPSSPRNL